MTTEPAGLTDTDHLARLGIAPAYTCGKCGQTVQANEPHDCPGLTQLHPAAVLPPPERADSIADLAVRVGRLEQQMAEILAGTPEQADAPGMPAEQPGVTLLVEKQAGRRKR